jgi:hypothetical protein
VDTSPHTISRYSPTGKFVRHIGQKGEGPGDIKRLGSFAINPLNETIYVTEFVNGNKWISRFSTDGKYLGDWKCELDRKGNSGLSVIKFDSNGNLYLQKTNFSFRPYRDFAIGTIENTIFKFSPEGKKLNVLYKFKADFNAEKGGKGNITIPYHNYLYWALFNDQLFIRESHSDSIAVFDTNGNAVKTIPLPFKKEKLREKDLDEWEERIKSTPFGKRGKAEGWLDLNYWRKQLPFPEYKPVSGRQLFFDSQGNLYSKKYEGYKPIINTWARIHLKNNETSIVKFKPAERLLAIWHNDFIFLRQDREGNYMVIKINKKDIFQGGKNGK